MTDTVNVWDTATWPKLTDLRQQLRDDIFDHDPYAMPAGRLDALERSLAWVEQDIAAGLTLDYPF
jgi:hypothetical protein